MRAFSGSLRVRELQNTIPEQASTEGAGVGTLRGFSNFAAPIRTRILYFDEAGLFQSFVWIFRGVDFSAPFSLSFLQKIHATLTQKSTPILKKIFPMVLVGARPWFVSLQMDACISMPVNSSVPLRWGSLRCKSNSGREISNCGPRCAPHCFSGPSQNPLGAKNQFA